MTINLPFVAPDPSSHPSRPSGGRPAPQRRPDPADGDDTAAGEGESDDGDDGATGDAQGDPDDDDGDGLGDAGKQAIDRMKTQRNRARTALRPWNALARELGVKTPGELKALLAKKSDSGDGGPPDADEIRRQARAEVERETIRDRVLDKIEAKARQFADPEDAAALLLRDRDVDDFLDGSRIDASAIDEALGELLENKPYLAAQGGSTNGGRKGPKPDPAQGARPGQKTSSLESGRALYAERHKKTSNTST